MSGNDSDLAPGAMETLHLESKDDSDSSESCNRNRFRLMLVESE